MQTLLKMLANVAREYGITSSMGIFRNWPSTYFDPIHGNNYTVIVNSTAEAVTISTCRHTPVLHYAQLYILILLDCLDERMLTCRLYK